MNPFQPGAGVAGRKTRLAFASGLGVILSACTASRPSGPIVPPGQFFPGPYLNITAPNSTGWHLAADRPNAWVFAKDGTQPDETYVALVSKFDLRAGITAQEFVAFVKSQVAADTDLTRFKNIEPVATLNSDRKYPCVAYRVSADDTKPRTESGKDAPLILEMTGLYCEDPLLNNAGFAAIYSHRGSVRDPQFDKDAADFIAGVQVPGN